MAAMADIVLPDGATTPVNHTFKPGSAVNGVFTWYEQNALSDVGNRKITMQVVRATNQGAVNRVIIKIWNPVLEILGPASAAGYVAPQRQAYTLQSTTEYLQPIRSSLQERKDQQKFVYNLQNNSQMVSAIVDLVVPTS
jgi:hypothetical protein